MKNDFDIHQWQAKFLKEDLERIMTAMEYLQKELTHLYGGRKDIADYEIAEAMKEYAEYLNSFTKSENK